MRYAEFLPRLAPPWLGGPLAQAFLTAIGSALDNHRARTKTGVYERLPGRATSDALPALGRDRVLPRGPGESDASYAGRLENAFQAYGWSGTVSGLLQYALAPAGFTTSAVIVNPQWSTSVATQVNDYGLGCGGSVPDGQSAPWAREWIVLAGTAWQLEGRWDDPGNWDDGSGTYDNGTWDTTALPSDVAFIRQLIEDWSPARNVFMGVFVVLPVKPDGLTPVANTSSRIDTPVPSNIWLEEFATFNGAMCSYWRFNGTIQHP